MKKIRYVFFVTALVALQSLVLISCGVKDSAIQASIETIKKDNPALASLGADVNKGVVTLSGELKDEAARSLAASSVKGIKGVKEVVDNTTVAPPPPPPAPPVVITADDPLTTAANDAVKDYPTVKASVKDGVVTLTGDIKRSELQKLLKGLHTLKPKKIDNQLTIK